MSQDRRADATLPIRHGAGDALLEMIGRDLADCPESEGEFSVRLRPGRLEVDGRFGVWLPADATAAGWLARLPVRHLAVAVSAPEPVVTLYCAAPLDGPWPVSEAILRQSLIARAGQERCAREEVWNRLPPLPAPQEERADLDLFYDGSASLWRPILGKDMHCHAGLFEDDDPEPDDAAMDGALRAPRRRPTRPP